MAQRARFFGPDAPKLSYDSSIPQALINHIQKDIELAAQEVINQPKPSQEAEALHEKKQRRNRLRKEKKAARKAAKRQARKARKSKKVSLEVSNIFFQPFEK
jgi:hypothetical protein